MTSEDLPQKAVQPSSTTAGAEGSSTRGTFQHHQYIFDDREKKLAISIESRVERRILNIIRQESADPYAGLPADDVLTNLHRAFPEVNFPERMMQRVEREQDARHAQLQRQSDLDDYEAETRRRDGDGDRKLVDRGANRAFLVFFILLVAGIVLTATGFTAAGLLLLGTTMVGVLGAFLAHQGTLGNGGAARIERGVGENGGQ